MKVSDYIVEFLIEKGITDVFGYPGGMVTHLMESFSQQSDKIRAHVNYHEQASAFCACGYAQVMGIPGVAYATSGPGATNLITGIANAYFDSVPTIFLTGQVNTFEAKGGLEVRQRGFQETDITSMIAGITKYSAYVSRTEDIRYELEKAWYYANEGRKGPVLLDIPMNIQRGEIVAEDLRSFQCYVNVLSNCKDYKGQIRKMLKCARKPVLLIGAGVKIACAEDAVREMVSNWEIPIVSSMLSVDVFTRQCEKYFGFIGAYGDRTANFIVAKSDLIISHGSRLDVRQIGAVKENFGTNAQLIRVDIDSGEFTRKIKEDELQVQCDIREFLKIISEEDLNLPPLTQWLEICHEIKKRLSRLDICTPNKWIQKLSGKFPEDVIITTDVGQNQVWIAQSFDVKNGQKILFSGGHGAMGYSLPAAIGAYYASGKPVICFCGDGGIQMNIQELQFVVREQLPITIIIINNSALGMIRHFQEMYFESNYYQTTKESGYTVPDFGQIANAYGLKYHRICAEEDIENCKLTLEYPEILEVILRDLTYVFPKLEFGKPNQDQEPLIDRKLYNYLMGLEILDERNEKGSNNRCH